MTRLVFDEILDHDQELGRVIGWRAQRFLEAGLDTDIALDLACDNHVDWHDLHQLIRQGCPPQTAVHILA